MTWMHEVLAVPSISFAHGSSTVSAIDATYALLPLYVEINRSEHSLNVQDGVMSKHSDGIHHLSAVVLNPNPPSGSRR